MSYKEIEAVPGNGDRDTNSIAPDTIATRKNHNCNVDECLEEVKKPKLWNDQC